MEKILKVLLVLFVIAGNTVVILAMNAGILELYIGVGIVALSLFFLASMYLDLRRNNESVKEDIIENENTDDEEIVSYYNQKLYETKELEEVQQDEKKEQTIDKTLKLEKQDLKTSNKEEEEEIETNSSIEKSQPMMNISDFKTNGFNVSGIKNQKRIKEESSFEKPQKDLVIEEDSQSHITKRVRYFKRYEDEDGSISYRPVKKEKVEVEVSKIPDETIIETQSDFLEEVEKVELNFDSNRDIITKKTQDAFANIETSVIQKEELEKLKEEESYSIPKDIVINSDDLGNLITKILASLKKEYSVVEEVSLSELFTYQFSQQELDQEQVSFIIQNRNKEPVAGVQIYNYLHKLKDKLFIATIFNKANLPLIAFHENSKYKVSDIKELLEEILE